MPHVVVKMFPGRTEEQKSRLAEAITKDLIAVLQCKEESVSVAIEDVDRQDWAEAVFKPEIQSKWDKVYKKPGYDGSKL